MMPDWKILQASIMGLAVFAYGASEEANVNGLDPPRNTILSILCRYLVVATSLSELEWICSSGAR